MSDSRPRWPARYGPVGLLAAFFVAFVGFGIVAVLSGDADSPGTLRVATLVQDAALVAVALWLAGKVARPRPEHFGLRRAPLGQAIGWTVLGAFAYLVFAAAYISIVGEPEKQTTLEDLGAEDSTATIAVVGIMVIAIAPFVEEFFFRGFVYGALRTSFGPLAAALLGGALFGVIHAPTGLEAVPPLVLLGVVFSLIYERVGSLYPVIVLHALNNWLTYGDQTSEQGIAGAIGLATVTACVLLARVSPAARLDSRA